MTTELAVGSRALGFKLPRDGGGNVALADFKGKKLVIYFYPKAAPGCTREAIDFSRLRADFQKAGTDVLGVSADPVKAQDKFRDKHDLKGALAGITRSTFLIGPDGRIARIWPKVRVDGHASEVLAAAKALPG